MKMNALRQPLRVLLVEDSPDDADLILIELNECGFDVTCIRVDTGAALRAALTDGWDVVISDFNLPSFNTREALAILREFDADIPFIIVSGCIGEESAIKLMKEGVSDFVMKNKLARLAPVIERELQDATVRREHRRAQESLREREQRYRGIFDNVLDSLYMLEVTVDCRFRNLEVNPAFEKSSGIPSAALVGKFIEELVSEKMMPEETARIVIDKYRRCVESGTATDEETTLELPSGIRNYHSSLIPVRDEGGRVHRIVGISRDITGRKQTERDLLKSRTELSELTAYLQTVREEERTRISRELHDELGQMLTGVKLDAMWVASHLSDEQPDIASKVAAMSQLIDETLDAMRRVAADLRPVMLDDLGLLAAIEWLTEEFDKRTGIDIHLEREMGQLEFGCGGGCEREGCNLEAEMATAAFRILQECLTNVARHAQATHVEVLLKCRDGQLKIWVSDDGKGMADNREKKRNSYGIIGMRERAHSLGGTLEFSSAPEKGTSVKVVLPIKAVSCAEGRNDSDLDSR